MNANAKARLKVIEATLNPTLNIRVAWVYFCDDWRGKAIENQGDPTVYHLSIQPGKPCPFPADSMLVLNGAGAEPYTDPEADPIDDLDRDIALMESPEFQASIRAELNPCLTPRQRQIVDQAHRVVIVVQAGDDNALVAPSHQIEANPDE